MATDKTNDNKTQKNRKSPAAFIKSVTPDSKRADAQALLTLFTEVTGEQPAMWGDSIVGYGTYHYQYDSGREGDSFMSGFSPRKQNFAIYIMPGFNDYQALLEKVGKVKTSKVCLYFTKLDKIHVPSLKKLIQRAHKDMLEKYSG